MNGASLASGLLTLALLISAHAIPAEAKAEHGEEWVRQRVKQIKDSDTDAWRRIPWAASLTAAAQAADKENRPIFVFSHEGNIDTGRC